MADTKTPAAVAAEAIVADLAARSADVGAYASVHAAVLREWTAIIAQACADAAAEERADVVAWLRGLIQASEALGNKEIAATHAALLPCIQAGDHVGAGKGA